jgi:hypothetical protein
MKKAATIFIEVINPNLAFRKSITKNSRLKNATIPAMSPVAIAAAFMASFPASRAPDAREQVEEVRVPETLAARYCLSIQTSDASWLPFRRGGRLT